MACETTPHVGELIDSRIDLAEKLCKQCRDLSHIQGMSKIQRKCHAELKFLRRIAKSGTHHVMHLSSSNLSYLRGIVETAHSLKDVTHLRRKFHYKDAEPTSHSNLEPPNAYHQMLHFDDDGENSVDGEIVSRERGRKQHVLVDIVCNHGYSWIKVIGRNAQGLHLTWLGEGQFGGRNTITLAKEYLQCASQNQCNYTTPRVLFVFYNGVTFPMKEALEQLGVEVHGVAVEVTQDVSEKLQPEEFYNDQESNIEDHTQNQPQMNYPCTVVDSVSFSDEEYDGNIMSASEYMEMLKNGGASGDANELDLYEHDVLYNDKSTDEHENDTEVRLCEKQLSDDDANSSCGDLSEEECCDDNANGDDISELDNKVLQSLHTSSSSLMSQPFTSLQSSSALSQNVRCDIRKLNLDVSTLICLVSNMCHGHCNIDFNQREFDELALQERAKPLLPTLDAFMKDKEWFVCQTAYDSFRENLRIIGGPQERERGRILLTKVKVIPDNVSQEIAEIQCSNKIKPRTKIVFGTGHSFQAITLSANNRFVRSVTNQGLNLATFVHASRALSEQREMAINSTPTAKTEL